jgi:hypothetical protein
MGDLEEYRTIVPVHLRRHLSVIRDLIRVVDACLAGLHGPALPGSISKTGYDATHLIHGQGIIKIDIGFRRKTIMITSSFVNTGFDDPVPQVQAALMIWVENTVHFRL